jgi:hypothetical protein
MVESIQYDSCEEWNGMGTDGNPSNGRDLAFSELSGVYGRYYPISNACGQFGKLYSDKGMCVNDGNDGFADNTGSGMDMSCEIDTTLEIEAASHPRYNVPNSPQLGNSRKYGPPPFYCGPKKRVNRFSGYWDGYSQEFVRDVAYPSALGKVDVEG